MQAPLLVALIQSRKWLVVAVAIIAALVVEARRRWRHRVLAFKMESATAVRKVTVLVCLEEARRALAVAVVVGWCIER